MMRIIIFMALFTDAANLLVCRWRKAQVTQQTAIANYQSLVQSCSSSAYTYPIAK